MEPAPFQTTSWQTRHNRGECLPAHRHSQGYISLVLEGGYEEVSIDGRFNLTGGFIAVHPPFHAHSNLFFDSDTLVLNVPLPPEHQKPGPAAAGPCSAAARTALEALIRADPRRGALASMEELEPHRDQAAAPWLQYMRANLSAVDSPAIAELAAAVDRSPEYASRAFRRWLQATPCDVRAEARLRRALLGLTEGATAATTAASAGYADQAHMCREFKKRIGLSPRRARELLGQICSIQGF